MTHESPLAASPSSSLGRRLLHGFSAVVALGFVLIARPLLASPTLPHLALLAVAAFVALRLIVQLSFGRAVPTIASGYAEQKKIIALLQADHAARKLDAYRVLDLGSGRGELARRIARAMPQAEVTGIERSFFPHHRAALLQKLLCPANLHFLRRDFTTHDCSAADAVVIYLDAPRTLALGDKLKREVKPGTLVICNTFPLPENWAPVETLANVGLFKAALWVYRCPAPV